ncbi:unnamed protein product [Litomosoides sigmodontis]|uniref:Uncharacterized protein n=1 Tax=Litomosoides sigmodontis TaxID=42156 RepID=A0A3P6UJ60_LITSI|nr:unnamed protein product [Litomosoides sigmodontis]
MPKALGPRSNKMNHSKQSAFQMSLKSDVSKKLTLAQCLLGHSKNITITRLSLGTACGTDFFGTSYLDTRIQLNGEAAKETVLSRQALKRSRSNARLCITK